MTDASIARPVLSGRYELHRRIARGGMADVFLARDQLLDRPVAVKVLFPQYAAEPTFVARFRREAQAAANLNHPSVVAVYDWGSHEDTYFIVMEYVEGRSLADVLASEGHLHPDRAAEIATDVAAALGFAHRNGTVHRDVKPGNIMITPAGQVKVTDFGIARAFGGGDDELTQTGSVMGTASYFSPEQAQGKPVDPRSDLYSLGVVLFEMVTGEPPFSGASPVSIAYKHVQEPAPAASAFNPSVPPPLDAIIARLLAKNPEHRYPAAEDVRADLRRFREGHPLAGQANGQVRPNPNLNPAAYGGAGYAGGPTAATAVHGAHGIHGPAATTAMARPDLQQRRPPESGSRAIIDTTRAVPASAAIHQEEPVEEYYEPPSRTGVFLLMLAGLLVLLIGLVFYVASAIIPDSSQTEPEAELVAVPRVVGESQVAAENRLLDEGLEFEVVFGESEEDPNTVYDQEPDAETEVEPGSLVTIYVSQAEEMVAVPDVVNLHRDDAVARLDELGFSVGFDHQPSDEVEVDHVVGQSIEAGDEINKGGNVLLIVSTGPEQQEIPNLAGMAQVDAGNVLMGLGFTSVTFDPETSTEVPAGQVIRSEPPAGTTVGLSAQIVVTVSDGAGDGTVPSVVGLAEAAAVNQLQNAGYVPKVQDVEVGADSGQVDMVLQQAPGGNSTAPLGSEVTIQVGRAPVDDGGTTTTTAADG